MCSRTNKRRSIMLVPSRQVSYVGQSPPPDSSDSDSADDYERPILPRPAKNYNLFEMNEAVSYQPKEIFGGAFGKLPFLIGVCLGYDPEDPSLDPFMQAFESQEIMFAFRRGFQMRAMLRDQSGRTLSLPVNSKLTFTLDQAQPGQALSLSQIVATYQLPLTLDFARPRALTFCVDGQKVDHSYFGSLTLTRAYEEPYFLCLSVDGEGKIRKNLRILPQNLYDVTFTKIEGVKGAALADQKAKLQAFLDRFSDHARQLEIVGDPFVQEMAFVSRKPEEVAEVQPYMEQNTFIPITCKSQPPRLAPRKMARDVSFPSKGSPPLPPLTPGLPSPHSSAPSYTNSSSSSISSSSSSMSERPRLDIAAELLNASQPSRTRNSKTASRSRSFNVFRSTPPLEVHSGSDSQLDSLYVNKAGSDEHLPGSSPLGCLSSGRAMFYTNTAGDSVSSSLTSLDDAWAAQPELAVTKQLTVSVTHRTRSFNKFLDDDQSPAPHRTHGGHNSYIKMDTLKALPDDVDAYPLLQKMPCQPSLSAHMYTNSVSSPPGGDAEEGFYEESMQRKTHVVKPFVTSAEIRAERRARGETFGSPPLSLPRYSDALRLLPPAPSPPLSALPSPPPPRKVPLQAFSYLPDNSGRRPSVDSLPARATTLGRTVDNTYNNSQSVCTSYSSTVSRRRPLLPPKPASIHGPQPLLAIEGPPEAQAQAGPDVDPEAASKRSSGAPSECPATACWDMSSLTVDEVAGNLRQLGLGRYTSKFRKHRIDGVLLKRMGSDMLQSEFGMSRLEILRLETFAKEGHIPQKAAKDRKSKKK